MISGIERVKSKRIWFVPDLVVWGLPSLGQYGFLQLDKENGMTAVYYGVSQIGESEQEVLFSQLTDHRGNQLPQAIKSPRVIVRPKSSDSVFLVGREASDSFRIARDPSADGEVVVDLMVVELGD